MSVIIHVIPSTAIMAIVLFLSAGQFGPAWFWAFIAIVVASKLIYSLLLDRGLQNERLRPGPGGIDRDLERSCTFISLAGMAAAGLDVGRFHWTDSVPVSLSTLGLLGMAASFALSIWSMRHNRFFSPVVRIQSERGHHVVETGPYRYVRHPGNLATTVLFPCMGLALGSWLATSLFLWASLLMLRRTAIEDVFLLEHLEDYDSFCRSTRYRLIPGVW